MSGIVGERQACSQFGTHRATYQRGKAKNKPINTAFESFAASDSRQVQRRRPRQALKVNRRSPRALTAEERAELLDAVHQERFVDRSVPYIYATLLDENQYYASISTMYRVLRSVGEVGERRDQAVRPSHVKPELVADAPNRVWAWDITKLHGPQKWTYFYLYAIIDIYSRYVVGWMVADRESSELAKTLLQTTIREQAADPMDLTIHSDRGSSGMCQWI